MDPRRAAGPPAPVPRGRLGLTAPELSNARVAGIRRVVLACAPPLWRELPWRATRDPWHVLVSEVMLQQTQAARVIEPYRRFVSRFPTPALCAAAGQAEVLRAWAGLGYNRRAVGLHRTAVALVQEHGGAVPADLGALRALPGVGEYTARAVLVFAFEMPVGVVDTNVARVLARAVAGRAIGRREAQRLADRLVAPDHPWRYTQLMFDVGATVCTARRPACERCPLRHRCSWVRSGRPGPDPAGRTRRQAAFAGSDRQGRGRLVEAIRLAPVPVGRLPAATGWTEDRDRARRAADALVSEGIARWSGEGAGEALHLA